MSNYRKFVWYRLNVERKTRILEGDELVQVLEGFIEDIKDRKLDKKIGLFRLLIRELESRISEMKYKPKQKSRQYDPFHVPRSGDGRIALFGVSNVGKSTLMNAITNTEVKTGNYLHTTRTALAGTCEYENLKIQIIDLPGFLDFKEDWAISRQIVRAARTCDAILLVIDLSMDIDRQYDFLMEQLEKAKLVVNGESLYKLGVIATKGDLPGSRENFIRLKAKTPFKVYPVSIKKEESLEKLKESLFESLEVIRVYTKPPRKKPGKQPFICPRGTSVSELVEKIHTDFLQLFRYAKIWGKSVDYPGQRVGLEHTLMDSDIIEITLNRKI
ncbi:MAG: GTPase [Candidatus Hodarchaeales archaeon]